MICWIRLYVCARRCRVDRSGVCFLPLPNPSVLTRYIHPHPQTQLPFNSRHKYQLSLHKLLDPAPSSSSTPDTTTDNDDATAAAGRGVSSTTNDDATTTAAAAPSRMRERAPSLSASIAPGERLLLVMKGAPEKILGFCRTGDFACLSLCILIGVDLPFWA